jgi:hypothetical protein
VLHLIRTTYYCCVGCLSYSTPLVTETLGTNDTIFLAKHDVTCLQPGQALQRFRLVAELEGTLSIGGNSTGQISSRLLVFYSYTCCTTFYTFRRKTYQGVLVQNATKPGPASNTTVSHFSNHHIACSQRPRAVLAGFRYTRVLTTAPEGMQYQYTCLVPPSVVTAPTEQCVSTRTITAPAVDFTNLSRIPVQCPSGTVAKEVRWLTDPSFTPSGYYWANCCAV